MKIQNTMQASLRILALITIGSMACTTHANPGESTERVAHMDAITAVMSKFFDSRDFKYPCDRHLMDFPERYDDLNNPSNARGNWSRAYTAADNFKSCVNDFLAKLPAQKVETVVPVYRYLNSGEKKLVDERFMQGIASLKNTIGQGVAKVDEELQAVAESQRRTRRAEIENRCRDFTVAERPRRTDAKELLRELIQCTPDEKDCKAHKPLDNPGGKRGNGI